MSLNLGTNSCNKQRTSERKKKRLRSIQAVKCSEATRSGAENNDENQTGRHPLDFYIAAGIYIYHWMIYMWIDASLFRIVPNYQLHKLDQISRQGVPKKLTEILSSLNLKGVRAHTANLISEDIDYLSSFTDIKTHVGGHGGASTFWEKKLFLSGIFLLSVRAIKHLIMQLFHAH